MTFDSDGLARGGRDAADEPTMHNYLKAEISASAIRHNAAMLRGCLPAGVKLCAVIKANAYGHGQDLLLPLMTELADWVGVATPAEALHLREIGYGGPVLVFFSACAKSGRGDLGRTLDELLRQRITLTITSRWELDVLTAATRRTDCDAKIHVGVDTGMTRSGVRPEQAAALIQEIRLDPALRLTGIYTHLATADEADKTAARAQLAVYEKVLRDCDISSETVLRHVASSAALIDLPESHYDMVRPGIGLYGYQPSDDMQRVLDLRPSLRLTGHLMQVKDVPAGTRVGYGLTHEFTRPSRVGLVPVGYGDGYLRAFSNSARMRVCDRLVPVVGRISMDQTTVDLTDVPDAQVGDEVEILSPVRDDPHSVESLARLAGTIPYEILCRLGQRVRRFLVD